eukprot:18487-Heterococcus_DN1.PRE.4
MLLLMLSAGITQYITHVNATAICASLCAVIPGTLRKVHTESAVKGYNSTAAAVFATSNIRFADILWRYLQ